MQGSGSAYVIATPLTIREGLDKTKPYHAFKVEVRNGRPHRAFIDYRIGTPALFEIDGILSADHVSALRIKEDATTPFTIGVSIGDDREADSGLARVVRNAQTFWNGLASIMGASQF